MNITKSPIRLHASAKAVVARFLHLPGSDRISNVVKRVEDINVNDLDGCLEKLTKEFSWRHHNMEEIFLNHFSKAEHQYGSSLAHFSSRKKLLLGAFLTKEYSIQAAALFNPSIVPHPKQHDLQPGEQRFIMSMRATGEGHISSVVFKVGIVDGKGNITLDSDSLHHTCLEKNASARYSKDFIAQRAAIDMQFNKTILDHLPDSFTAAQAMTALKLAEDEKASIRNSMAIVEEIFDTNYELEDSSNLSINAKVIFPIAKAESMGMEDTRFVKFEDEGHCCYYGTYTAYDGKRIRTQMIETADFNTFKIRALYGSAIQDKGMALFPEKINGKFVMISRQGGEKIQIMFSEDLYFWEKFQVLMEPRFTWELVQLGNCGSPIKTDKGWLLLTHGVGPMRAYVISAILLDLDDPRLIIGRLDTPLIEADESEREGYVPNVVYTCGMMRHGNLLIVPYAVSDSATGFATIMLDDLLKGIKP